MKLVSSAARRASIPILAGDVGNQLVATGTDKSDESRRIAHDQSMRRNVVSHHSSGANQSKGAHRNTGQENRSGANRSTLLDQRAANFPVRVPLELSIRSDGAGQSVVGKASVRTNEYSVLNGSAMIDAGTILDFDLTANDDVKINVHPFANDTLLTNTSTLAYLHLVPNLCSGAYRRLR